MYQLLYVEARRIRDTLEGRLAWSLLTTRRAPRTYVQRSQIFDLVARRHGVGDDVKDLGNIGVQRGRACRQPDGVEMARHQVAVGQIQAGRPDDAFEHIAKAAGEDATDGYMGDVARVHAARLERPTTRPTTAPSP